jgi:hypothetical protein
MGPAGSGSDLFFKKIKLKITDLFYVYFFPLNTKNIYLPLSELFISTRNTVFKKKFMLTIVKRWIGSGSASEFGFVKSGYGSEDPDP